MRIERDPALAEAAKSVGGIIKLSVALNLSRAAASQWRRVPPERVLDVERLTGVSRYRLRPDLYGSDPVPINGSGHQAAAHG